MLTINSYICLGKRVLVPFLRDVQVCGSGSLLLPSVGPGQRCAGRKMMWLLWTQVIAEQDTRMLEMPPATQRYIPSCR